MVEEPKEEGLYLVFNSKTGAMDITEMYIGQETTMCESPIANWVKCKCCDPYYVYELTNLWWWKHE